MEEEVPVVKAMPYTDHMQALALAVVALAVVVLRTLPSLTGYKGPVMHVDQVFRFLQLLLTLLLLLQQHKQTPVQKWPSLPKQR